MPSSDSLTSIRNSIDTADRCFQVIDGGKGDGGGPPEAPQEEQPCPVAVVGHLDGSFYFLDRVGQLRVLRASQMTRRPDLLSLFGGSVHWLKEKFPKTAKVKEKDAGGDEITKEVVVDFNINRSAEFLQRECFHAGLYGDHIKIRRPGIWPAPDGMPVVHCGDRVLIGSRLERPGTRIGDQIWAAAPAQPRPGKPCDREIPRLLQKQIDELFNFRIPGSSIIIMGMLACAYYGAAIPWRPAGFLTGPAGSGKSSLLKILANAIPLKFSTNDASKAGIEQTVDGRAIPMLIDEASDRIDQRMARALLDLVLSATSGEGTNGARGGVDGVARKISVSGSIIMASIRPPDMEAQHFGRFTIVEMKAASTGSDHTTEHRDLAEWASEHGPALWGRTLAGWERYREARIVLRAAVGRSGCQPREMDQMGSLLAGWWTLTSDHVPTEQEADNAVLGVAGYIRNEEETQAVSGTQQMVDHWLSQTVQMQRSTDRRSMSALISRMLKPDGDVDFDDEDDTQRADLNYSRKNVESVLAMYGIRVVRRDEPLPRSGMAPPRGSEGDGLWIWPRNAMLSDLFKDTPYAGQKFVYELMRMESFRQAGKDRNGRPLVIKMDGRSHKGCIRIRCCEIGLSDDG
ncbi:ATP-binding protein [Acetobacter musti]|uniref:ATP-binding protein n=1 Tax=Acetobacter musti TaxID=864732 RepID=A0ABX0JJQ4_9PROT|nr:ATP-binding protein [Acetobacter musti]NHN83651.1 ATP-binding protein [Acetobacter musti]